MVVIRSEALTSWCTALLVGAGAPRENAAAVAESLVTANLLGHDSHGVLRVPRYIAQVQKGQVDPTAKPRHLFTKGACAQVDGNGGFGQLGAQRCCEIAEALALEHGMATVALINTFHIGRLGEYAERLARKGLFTTIMTTGGGGVAPFGGRRSILGTNPMAWGIPRGPEERPIVADFSTSVLPEGKLAVFLSKGEALREGALLNKDGNPSTNPGDFYEGGVLLPFGEHKGYALSLATQIAGAMLTGNSRGSGNEVTRGNPTFIAVWSIDIFAQAEDYYRQVEELARRIETSEPAPGFDEVMLPGTPEHRSSALRRSEGIPLPESTWNELVERSRELSVAIPETDDSRWERDA